MAEINLLTIHYGKCYGAVMQTYATCRLLESAGHSVNIINLINPSQRGQWKNLNFWKDCVREFQFWIFKHRYFSKMTHKGYSIDEINLPEADYTIVGSDQVWNRDITGVFGTTFFLDFVMDSKVALSSSFGKSEWTEGAEYTRVVKGLLNGFKAISVREQSGVNILNNIFDIQSTNLVDPTLGYAKFDHLILNKNKKNQIFTFLLNDNSQAKELAQYIANSLKRPLFKHTGCTARFMNGPRHWLTRIYNSSYVITDSFHGLALSIIFHKQFYVFCASEAKFTRLHSLLKLLSLEDRYIKSTFDFDNRKEELMKAIDYNRVQKILKSEQDKYLSFIQENL